MARGVDRPAHGPVRCLLAGAACVMLAASGALVACSDDDRDPTPTSLAPTTAAPSESTSSSTPDGDSGQSGAKPGRIPENVDPPGGTTPDSEGGSDNDATGSDNDDAGDQTEGP